MKLTKTTIETSEKSSEQQNVITIMSKCSEYKSHTKQLWSIINEIAGKKSDKSSLIEYLQIENTREYGAKKISNSLAKYFAHVGKKFAGKIPSPTTSINDYLKCLQSNKTSIFLSPTDIWEIKRIVSKLPSKKSSGHDNIRQHIAKRNHRQHSSSIGNNIQQIDNYWRIS